MRPLSMTVLRKNAADSKRITRASVESLEARQMLSTVPTLDTTFNHNGEVLANWAGGTHAMVESAKVLPNGQIVAIGQGIPSGKTNQELFVARFNSDGSADNTFNTATHLNYRFYDPFPGATDFAGGILQLSDGSFIVSGSSGAGVNDPNAKGYLFKFTSAGNLDTTFGVNGSYTDSVQSIQGLVTQGSDLLIGGLAGTSDFSVSRLTSAGKLDTTFGSNGRTLFTAAPVSSDSPSTNSPSGYLSVRADSSFVYSGVIGSSSRSGLVANFTAQGKLAPAFGSSSGEFAINYGGDDPAHASLRADGSLLVSDPQFSGSSSVTYYFGTISTTGTASTPTQVGFEDLPTASETWATNPYTIQPDGKLILAAYTASGDSAGPTNNGGYQSGLWRTTTNLSGLDTTFGTNGLYSLSSSTGGLYANSATITPDGKLLIAGFAETNGVTSSIMLARYNINPGTGNITGSVFNDANFNKALDAGEALANVPVYIDKFGTGKYQSGDPIVSTDSFGNYALTGLAPGTYTVRVDLSLLPSLGYLAPTAGDYVANVVAGGTVANQNFDLAGPGAAVYHVSAFIPNKDATVSTSNGTDFGTVAVNAAGPMETFTIKNIGAKPLTLSGLTLPAGFTLVTAPSAGLAVGASTTFTVKLITTKAGTFSGNVTFNDNVAAASPYTFKIQGAVAVPVPVLGLTAPDPTALDPIYGSPGSTGAFVLQRTGVTTSAVTLTLQLSGTAKYTASAKDFNFNITGATGISFNYSTNRLTLTLAANAMGAAILVSPLASNFNGNSETVILTLIANSAYSTTGATSATVIIAK